MYHKCMSKMAVKTSKDTHREVERGAQLLFLEPGPAPSLEQRRRNPAVSFPASAVQGGLAPSVPHVRREAAHLWGGDMSKRPMVSWWSAGHRGDHQNIIRQRTFTRYSTISTWP